MFCLSSLKKQALSPLRVGVADKADNADKTDKAEKVAKAEKADKTEEVELKYLIIRELSIF